MEQKRRSGKRIDLYLLVSVVFLLLVLLLVFGYKRKRMSGKRKQVTIAVPYSERVQDYETNYYTLWLEEQTGYDIVFVYLAEGYERESLRGMLTSGNDSVDGIFLPAGQTFLSKKEYKDYIKKGCLCAPEEWLEEGSGLGGVQEKNPEVSYTDLLGEDGKFYCFPFQQMSKTDRNMQVLWINIDWLKGLNLTIPKTVDELASVLRAFREKDPNGNGKADELPLICCEADEAEKSYRYLINSFVYYDGTAVPGYGEREDIAKQQAFRKGIAYCRELYAGGLLCGDTFSYTKKQVMELVNDTADMVGAFASHSIADVVYTNNPGILANFMQVAPLASEELEKGYAVRANVIPEIGGLIPASAKHKKEAAQIMDLMISEAAALIALYGEEGVDWRVSKDGELSTYGTRANITTIHYLKGERQNKNYASVGPLIAPAEYLDGVTWNGDHSMTEYIDARAVKSYEPYYSEEEPANEVTKKGRQEELADFLDGEILRFILGEKDIQSDADWQDFLREYDKRLR